MTVRFVVLTRLQEQHIVPSNSLLMAEGLSNLPDLQCKILRRLRLQEFYDNDDSLYIKWQDEGLPTSFNECLLIHLSLHVAAPLLPKDGRRARMSVSAGINPA